MRFILRGMLFISKQTSPPSSFLPQCPSDLSPLYTSGEGLRLGVRKVWASSALPVTRRLAVTWYFPSFHACFLAHREGTVYCLVRTP